MQKEHLNRITTSKLLKDREISIRAKNCCDEANLYTVLDIINFKESGNSFTSIKNAGKKTKLELEAIYKEYSSLTLEDLYANNIIDRIESSAEKQARVEHLLKTNLINARKDNLITNNDIFNDLNINQKNKLEKIYNKFVENSSTRTRKRLSVISFKDFFLNYMFFPNNKLSDIEGFGKRSMIEGRELQEKIKFELIRLYNLSDEGKLRLNLEDKYGEIISNEFVYNFYNKNLHLPMFWILHREILKEMDRDIEILIKTFPVFQYYDPLPLSTLAEMLNMSYERCRQIRKNVIKMIFEFSNEIKNSKKPSNIIKIIKLLNKREEWDYFFSYMDDDVCIVQSDPQISNLLKKEECKLTSIFVLEVIANIFKDTYGLIGSYASFTVDNTWKNTFLIKKELADVFNFTKLKNEIQFLKDNNISEKVLHVKTIIENPQYWKKFDSEKIAPIIKSAKIILQHEVGLLIDNEGFLKIPLASKLDKRKLIYDILQRKGEGMTIEDIFIEFKKIAPSHKFAKAKDLKYYVKTTTDVINIKGRRSIYILKGWEGKTRENIRDAIVEFLEKKDAPQTIKCITQEILQYFPDTNSKSIRTSIASDTKKRYAHFSNKLIGLSNKQYPSRYEKIDTNNNKTKTIDKRISDLKVFLEENNHFPFSSSKNEEEKSLRRWLDLVERGKKVLNESQQSELTQIKELYSHLSKDKGDYEWNINYSKLLSYVLENHRLPSSICKDKYLFYWWNRAQKDFSKDKLSNDNRKKYLEMEKLISDYKR